MKQENKINIAELLKDCPKGMELDSTMLEGLEFDDIIDNEYLPIRCRVKNPDGGYNVYNFTKYGCWLDTTFAKCVIFPKGKTTWEGFQRPFKDGDILTVENESNPFIFYCDCDGFYNVHCALLDDDFISFTTPNKWTSNHRKYRLATEEEKQKLFDAIKANGYKWNAETKTLEKLIEPKFKVGDVIQDIDTYKVEITEVNIEDECYGYESTTIKGIIGSIGFNKQDDWELIPHKFDVTTLKPFESRVLVRNSYNGFWQPTFWGIYEAEKANEHQYRNYLTTKGFFRHCIPYNDDTKHLLGTTDDCDEYYKTW